MQHYKGLCSFNVGGPMLTLSVLSAQQCHTSTNLLMLQVMYTRTLRVYIWRLSTCP